MSPTTDAWFDAAHGSWLDAGQTGKTVGGGARGMAGSPAARLSRLPQYTPRRNFHGA